MKRWICVAVLSFTAALLMSVGALAASGLNANEQNILAAARQALEEVKAVNYPVDANWLNQAWNYMLRDDVDLTSSQASKILGYIAEAKTTIINAATAAENAPQTQKQKEAIAEAAFESVKKAGKVDNLTFSHRNNVITVTEDATGNVVFITSAVIKATGAPVGVLSVPAVLAVAAGAFLMKKRLKR